jgi:integrase
MFHYLQSKNAGPRQKKTRAEKVCSPETFMRLIEQIELSKEQFNQNANRDYALIYIAYWMGLRIGEACILEKRHFARLESEDIAMIPTLKQKLRIPYVCAYCGRKCKVSADRIGEMFECPRAKCGSLNEVVAPNRFVSKEHVIPEKETPFIEPKVQIFILNYIASLPPDEKWLFPSRRGDHISDSFASRIFSTYLMLAGLPVNTSFHSLRHGRGQMLYSITDGDLIAVRDALRHKDTKTTEIYASNDPEKNAQYKELLDKRAQKMFKNKDKETA